MSRLPVVAAAATGVQVGATMVATRFVIDQSDPASLALLRYLIGFGCLVLPALMTPRPRFVRRDLAAMALLGIGQFGILVALLNVGLQTVPAARASLIFATFPFLTLLLAAAIGHERLTRAKAVGVLLTITGVGFALGEKTLQNHQTATWLGELAVFAGAVVGAVCSVFYRPYLRRYPAIPVCAVAMLAAVIFLVPLAAQEGFFATLPPRFSAGGWLAVLFVGLSSGAGYVLWLWALGRVSATRVTVFLALSPVTAILLGALFLGERISAEALVGVAGIAVGLWLAQRPDDTTAARDHPQPTAPDKQLPP